MMDGGFEDMDARDKAHQAAVGHFQKGVEYCIKGKQIYGTALAGADADGLIDLRMASGDIKLFPDTNLEDEPPRPPPPPRARTFPKAPLKFLSYADMVDLPDTEWLIDGLLMKNSSALLFGKSNSFKSFLAVDIACHVGLACGTDYAGDRSKLTHWHGHKMGEGWSVLYIATEGGLGVAKQRIPGWYEARNIPVKDRNGVTLFPQEIALDDDQSVNDLLRTCGIYRATETDDDDWRDLRGAFNLVVIDIFGASMMGPETSDETARAWVRNVNRIMREMNCAVLTIAHTGWSDGSRARGHTHFWGSFDTRLIAEGDKDSLTTVLKVDRHKDADSMGEWGFRLDKVSFKGKHGRNLTTLVPRLCDEVQTKQKRRVSGKPAVALQALSEALIDQGHTIAGPSYPNRPVVSLETWRAMCDRHGLTDSDNPDTTRKAFNRARTALLEKGLIKQFDENVWKVQDHE
jgi:hypothetical protein